MAATTVVVGYLSNPADARRLTSSTEQDTMAAALAEGIRNYANQLSQGDITSDTTGGN
jgi:N-acetylmuramoyl-L-alanine amidase